MLKIIQLVTQCSRLMKPASLSQLSDSTHIPNVLRSTDIFVEYSAIHNTIRTVYGLSSAYLLTACMEQSPT